MSLSSGELSREYPDGRPPPEQPQWRRDFPTDVPQDDLVARREFTKFLVLTSGAFVAGQCWIGAMSLRGRGGPTPARRVARAADVPARGVVEFRYPTDDDPCLLVRLDDGRLVAYGQKCTHLACAVVPQPEIGQLRCPCHNGAFEIREGRPVAGPPRRPLPRITLEVRGDGFVYATGVELRTT
jgi:nitrite reductase/ring-hydroxylating ferredoxin subunit